MKISPCLAVAAILLSGGTVASAQTLPAYMAPIAGKTAATPSDTATKDMLALNTGMFELYGDAAKIFQKNILAQASGDPRPVLGRRRPDHPLSAGNGAARSAAGARSSINC